MDFMKCGEIYLKNSNDFILVCGLCGARYHEMATFGVHIVENHPLTEEKSTATIKFEETQQESDEYEPAEILESGTSAVFSIEEVCIADYSDVDADDIADKQHTLKSSDESVSPKKEITETNCSNDRKADVRLFCNICLKQYFVVNEFSEHYIKHHGGGFICQYCAMGFGDQESLESHQKNHDLQSPYTCLHCFKTFTTKRVRQDHIKVIHMGQKNFKCTHCSSSFDTRTKLRVHMLTHSFPGTFHCEVCGRQFIHASRKRAHMRRHTGEKPFQCELCGKYFILRSLLTNHIKRHNDTKNYECNVCEKRFHTNLHLKDHLVVHSNEKSFECPDCGKTFARSRTLRTHRKIHSDIKQYSCNICGKEFSQAPGLYTHKKSHGTMIGT